MGLVWENTALGLGTKLPHNLCAGIGPLQLGVVLVSLTFPIVSKEQNFFFFQTFLEQTKTKFNKNYQGMNLAKITSTVGLNSKSVF